MSVEWKESCNNCKHKQSDKEWGNIVGCSIAKAKNDSTMLILGKKGICPYHEFPEYYGFK